MARPLLNPACPGWKEDLPNPYTIPSVAKTLGDQIPNHQCLTYLEIPRQSVSSRGLISVFAFFLIMFLIFSLYMMAVTFNPRDTESLLLSAFEILLVSWMVTIGLRMDISPPRDEPIRFNRARQKIYAYNFKRHWWNPFDKGKVVPVSYDWSQVRAERWSQTGALPNGGVIFKWGVMLSIVAPGTNNVIDRFHLSTMGADQHAWAYICTYMQEGPSALPPPGEPKDHNDVLWCEFALRLAPRVVWPTEMDLESRTAP